MKTAPAPERCTAKAITNHSLNGRSRFYAGPLQQHWDKENLMCETIVYLESDGQREKLVEDVLRLEPVPGGVWLHKLFEPPRTVAVLGDPTSSEHWVADCSAATENLLLAAAGLGLGAVWVGVYPDQGRDVSVRAVLNAPEPWRVLCLLPVGHPAENKPPRTRFEASKVHVERWGRSLESLA
jgi:hypothetical protein